MPPSSPASNTYSLAVPESATTAAKHNKKTKITFAEKAARQTERQFRERQKAEEKTRKDEEKAKTVEQKYIKAEKQRVRDAEKEERKKTKEEQAKLRGAEKLRKLEERNKAEEEKNKKARVCHYIGIRRVVTGNPDLPTVTTTSQRIFRPTLQAERDTMCIANRRYSKSDEQPAQLDCGNQGFGRPPRTVTGSVRHPAESSSTGL